MAKNDAKAKMKNDVHEERLPNGLMLLVKEIHVAPVASNWVFYRVGSRNERPGITGISHWVEHMMFKGTPTFPKGSIMRLVNKNGGILNGFTSTDYTVYFETFPSSRVELGLQIEADRMANSIFDAEEFESERTVIISEREGAENSPTFLLYEELRAAAFRSHPYGHQVLGWKEDLVGMKREDLWGYYKSHYGPHNAVVVVVGDVEAGEIAGKVRELFGPIPRGPEPEPVRAVEPPQTAERRVVLKQEGTASYFQAAYHVPNSRHEDNFPLMMLDAVLSGMRVAGGGTSTHRSSRLYRALVETELASSVDSDYTPSIDPDLFEIHATVREGHTLDEVERTVFEQVELIRREPIGEDELEKARKQARAQFAYALEKSENQAYWLGKSEVLEGYHRFGTFLEDMGRVTVEDVQHVAQKYLEETNRTVGWFVPTP